MEIHESAENYLETILVIGKRKPQVRSSLILPMNFLSPSPASALL